MIYRGRVRTEGGMMTEFTYDPYGGNTNMQEVALGQGAYPGNNGYSRNNNGADNSYPYNAPQREPAAQDNVNQPDYSPKTEPEAPIVTRDENQPAASPVIVDEGSMTDAKISKLKGKVTAKATDTEKLKALKDGLQNERITTYQVSVMMDWFTFENTKLEFAKWAYDITVDKSNFGDLGSKFTYKDSEEDLKKFLQSK